MNAKDVTSGSAFALVGLVYGSIAFVRLPIGSVLDMGPGYFPMLLSGLLVILGGSVAICGILAGGGSVFGRVAWRAVVLIALSIMAFSALLRPLGLLPTAIVTAFLASLSHPEITIRAAAITSVGIGIFCFVVFGLILRLPIPLLGSLFG